MIAVAVFGGFCAAAPAQPLYPNLVPDPPRPLAPSVYDEGDGPRLLLRFDGYVYNAGPGPVEIRGSSPFGPIQDRLMGSVVQRIYNDDGATPDTSTYEDRISPSVLRYETNDGHRHWHLREATRYSLWNSDRTAEVAPNHKIGFCLADIQAVDVWAPVKRYDYTGNLDRCAWLDDAQPDSSGPNAPSTVMGISAGWRDVYGATMPLQWVDVSNVPPGEYWLRTEVNPTGAVIEDPDAPIDLPVFSPHPAVVPGYVAAPVALDHIPANKPSPVVLSHERFGRENDNDVRYKIVEPPEHGVITASGGPVGAGWWRLSQLVYTPDSNYFGPDSFQFVAGDAARLAFPETPQSAAVTMQVGIGGPTALAISGAPAELSAGGSVQLLATVTAGPSPDVEWKVEGVVGGAESTGTITQDGLYRAPDHVHSALGDVVRVSATTTDDVSDHVDILIVPPPPPLPLPEPPLPQTPAPPAAPGPGAPPTAGRPVGATPAPPPRTRPSRRPVAVMKGRRTLLVRVVPPRDGRLAIVVRSAGRRAGGCTVRAVRGVAVTCRIRLAARHAARGPRALRVVGQLRAGRKIVKRWRLAPASRAGRQGGNR